MFTAVIHGIASVGMVMPHQIGKKLVLRFTRPVAVTPRVVIISTRDFLQKNQIGVECAQLIAQRMDHHPAVENGQPLVDVESRDTQLCGGFVRQAVHCKKKACRLSGTPLFILKKSGYRQHAIERDACKVGLALRDLDLVDHLAFHQIVERPRQMLRINARHG